MPAAPPLPADARLRPLAPDAVRVGAVYTPAGLAADILAHTIDPLLLPTRRPGRADPPVPVGSSLPRILDPACGAGVFLVAAFTRLLTEAQTRAGPAAISDPAARTALLRDRIFGVDLDAEAVTATRRALATQVLANASGSRSATPAERAALDRVLADNIRHGDALIDPADWLAPGPPPPAAFAWADAFPAVRAAGGFDAVVGNPPYRRERDAKALFDRIVSTGFGRRWRAPRMDLWHYFVHRGLDLLAPAGRLGFIVNGYWTAGRGAAPLIERLRADNLLDAVIDLDRRPVFPGVSGRHLILILDRAKTDDRVALHRSPGGTRLDTVVRPAGAVFHAGGLALPGPCSAPVVAPTPPPGVRTLETVATVRQGLAENPATITARLNARHGGAYETGAGVFHLSATEAASLAWSAAESARLLRPYHDLCDLGRYRLNPTPASVLIYATPETAPELDRLPGLRAHLARFRPILEARRETRLGRVPWWQLHWPRAAWLWTAPKLIALQMARRPSFALAETPCWTSFSTHLIVPHENTRAQRLRLLGWLNAAPVRAWLEHHGKRRGVGLDLSGTLLRRVPVPVETPTTARLWRRLGALAAVRVAQASTPEAAPPVLALEMALDATAWRLWTSAPS